MCCSGTPTIPAKRAAGHIEKDHWREFTLARLHEGERLKSLIVRAKPPGNMTKAWASLTKRSFRVKKYFR